MLGKIEGRRRRQQRMRWLDGVTDSLDMRQQTLGHAEGQGQVHGVAESDTTERLSNIYRLTHRCACLHGYVYTYSCIHPWVYIHIYVS